MKMLKLSIKILGYLINTIDTLNLLNIYSDDGYLLNH